jgi:hypothetical protein
MLREFHNTTHESDQLAFDFNEINKAKNKDVLAVFEANPGVSFTPYQVGDIMIAKGSKMLQSSIKRAITDLTKQGLLVQTSEKVIERYGRPNYKWMLK